MTRRILAGALTWGLLAAVAGTVAGAADTAPDETLPEDHMQLQFTAVPEAIAILTQRDDFVQALSPFDRAVRAKSAHDVSEAEFLELVAASVVPWDDTTRAAVESAARAVRARLAAWRLPFPAVVQLVRTSGREEAGSGYTRGRAIVFTAAGLAGAEENLRHLLCHELFHVLSRANPALRDELYAAIGFVPCAPLAWPPSLAARRITNPDAPQITHRLRVRVGTEELWTVPVLLADAERYDPARGGGIFDYLQFKLLVVAAQENGGHTLAVQENGAPRFVDPALTPDFFAQIGRNTNYIIHPEEILAENFALLILGYDPATVPTPALLERLRRILANAAMPPAPR